MFRVGCSRNKKGKHHLPATLQPVAWVMLLQSFQAAFQAGIKPTLCLQSLPFAGTPLPI